MGTQTFPVTRRWQAGMLEDSLLNIVGNSWRVDEYGVKQWDRRDAVDDSLVAHFRNDTGRDSVTYGAIEELISTGLPTYSTGVACADSDADGMCDAFENLHAGLNPNDATDNDNDPDGDGFLNAEEFVNGTNPTIYTASDGTETAGTPGSTYGDDRRAHLVPLVTDTVITRDTLGIIQDTFIRKGVDRDAVPVGTPFRAIFHPGGNDSSIVLTYDTLVGAVTDSPAVDSILADWNVPTPPYPWAVDVPGQP
jgi:hypothetical protein